MARTVRHDNKWAPAPRVRWWRRSPRDTASRTPRQAGVVNRVRRSARTCSTRSRARALAKRAPTAPALVPRLAATWATSRHRTSSIRGERLLGLGDSRLSHRGRRIRDPAAVPRPWRSPEPRWRAPDALPGPGQHDYETDSNTSIPAQPEPGETNPARGHDARPGAPARRGIGVLGRNTPGGTGHGRWTRTGRSAAGFVGRCAGIHGLIHVESQSSVAPDPAACPLRRR